jgi:hypothetical protein
MGLTKITKIALDETRILILILDAQILLGPTTRHGRIADRIG